MTEEVRGLFTSYRAEGTFAGIHTGMTAQGREGGASARQASSTLPDRPLVASIRTRSVAIAEFECVDVEPGTTDHRTSAGLKSGDANGRAGTVISMVSRRI